VLEEQGVFELVKRPPGYVKIERVEVIKTVRDDGSLRARICFNGSQQDEFTYTQTASPVAPSPLIRMFFAICAARGMPPRGGDFSGAYLFVEETFPIYAKVFDEFKDYYGREIDYSGKVLKLKKKLYGAKSSGLGWYEHLRELLQSAGFFPCPTEPALFLSAKVESDGKKAMLITVVDDFIVSSSEETYLKLVKHFEENGYTITGKGIARRFSGLNIKWDEKRPHEISLDQEDKIRFICEDHGDQPAAKVRKAPLHADHDAVLDKEYEPTKEQTKDYMSLLGKLMHISTLSLSFS
jgi:hypothetical protein